MFFNFLTRTIVASLGPVVVSDETLMAKIRVNKLGDDVSLSLL